MIWQSLCIQIPLGPTVPRVLVNVSSGSSANGRRLGQSRLKLGEQLLECELVRCLAEATAPQFHGPEW